MLLRVCDRCKKDMSTSVLANRNFTIVPAKHELELDLCDECYLSFEKWMTVTPHYDKFPPTKTTTKSVITPPMKETDFFKKPEKKEDPKTQEKIDLENKMNNAYAQGNDALGDSISERLQKLAEDNKEKKREAGEVTSKCILFKTIAQRDLFVSNYSNFFTPFARHRIDYLRGKTRNVYGRKKYTDEQIKRELNAITFSMENGWFIDFMNPLILNVRILDKDFSNVKDVLREAPKGKKFKCGRQPCYYFVAPKD